MEGHFSSPHPVSGQGIRSSRAEHSHPNEMQNAKVTLELFCSSLNQE